MPAQGDRAPRERDRQAEVQAAEDLARLTRLRAQESVEHATAVVEQARAALARARAAADRDQAAGDRGKASTGSDLH